MAERRLSSGTTQRSELQRPCELVPIARLRRMIRVSESRKERLDFAEAIHRLETGAARAVTQDAKGAFL